MNTLSLVNQHSRLSVLIDRAATASNNDLELQSHWAQYACIRAAGFIENALGEVYAEYARRCSNTKVGNYVSKSTRAIQNPKAAKFLDTAGRFSPEWSEQLDTFLNDNGRREAINSIMTNRHLIAHGQNSDITVVRVKEYLARSVEVIEFIEGQCDIPTVSG